MFEKAKDFINKLGLTGDEYEDDDFAGDEEDEVVPAYDKSNDEVEEPKRKFAKKQPSYVDDEEEEEAKPARFAKKTFNKVTPMNTVQGDRKLMELKVITPKVYDDSREIADNLSEGKPVVLNLEGLNADLAQRILDFASGAVYAKDGNLQKITSYIFVITPSNVKISGNFDEIIDGNIDLSGTSKYVFRD